MEEGGKTLLKRLANSHGDKMKETLSKPYFEDFKSLLDKSKVHIGGTSFTTSESDEGDIAQSKQQLSVIDSSFGSPNDKAQ